MTALVTAGNTAGALRMVYVNSGPSTAVVNTAAETVFDQYFTYPLQSQRATLPTTLIRLRTFGIFSTGLLNLGLTLRLRWGGVAGTLLCSSGSLSLQASASNIGWSAEAQILMQAVGPIGVIEGQGYAAFAAGALAIAALPMANAGTFTVDTTVASDLVLTAQWGTAAAANSIQLRTCVVEVDGP